MPQGSRRLSGTLALAAALYTTLSATATVSSQSSGLLLRRGAYIVGFA